MSKRSTDGNVSGETFPQPNWEKQKMPKTPLTLGLSPCPNDTFIFYALVHGLIDCQEPITSRPRLEDVETLNECALREELDVTKLSFHAYGHVRDRYLLLDSGSALGRGCGPLLISKRKGLSVGDLPGMRVAVPGRLTTAAMLLRLFCPDPLLPPHHDAVNALPPHRRVVYA